MPATVEAAAQSPAAGRGGDDRPNIVVVMTDDQRLDGVEAMPSVRDGIARSGVTFTESSASLPVCCPSRATFLTGQYAHNNGVGAAEGEGNCLRRLDETTTLPVSLSRAGYDTAMLGKYVNGYARRASQQGPRDSIPPGWDSFQALTEFGYFDWELNDNGTLRSYGSDEADYQTDVLADYAESYVGEHTARGAKPFFLYIATNAPHGETGQVDGPNPRPAPRHQGAFADAELPRSPSFNEEDVSDKPFFLRKPLLTAEEQEALANRYRSRLESLLSVDEMIAALRAQLQAAGELRNTVFLFTSDNGFLLGEHRLEKKTVLYEESAEVPLVISGPGFRGGREISSPVSNIDLAPTILKAAGATPARRPLDGVALQRIVERPQNFLARDLLLENRGAYSDASEAVRDQRYVYIKHSLDDRTFRELYDLDTDPYELENRAGDPELAEVQKRLGARLRKLSTCAGARCR